MKSAGWRELSMSCLPGLIIPRQCSVVLWLTPRMNFADRWPRFYRVDQHRSSEGGGAGLGLSIVARLVAERGGTAHVGDAKPGASFTVRLPLEGFPTRTCLTNPAVRARALRSDR